MNFLGEAITITRRARGLTQEELAEVAGVTQAALSRYETSMREPDREVLIRIADALGVTPRFLEHAGRARGAMAVDAHMRRRQTAKPTIWKRLEAQLNVYRMHASMLFDEIALHAEQHIPTFDPITTDPADAARLVRMQWRMPIGSVRGLMQWLEAAGCLIIEADFGTSRIDGLSQWVDGHPIMFINSEVPTDRKRLTLAHELGHLVLHSEEVVEDVEDQANMFAAEFLMPIDVIRPQLRSLRVDALFDLKREWGVSMAAIIERAHTAGLIKPNQRTSMYKLFSARGWRTSEPVSQELAPERPSLQHDIFNALSERGLHENEIASLAGFRSSKHNDLIPARRGNLHRVV
jgi:Zn-dependent peptidase ImmA (M78 family)/DNA-binding XRE family transcriptional regulator